jgi:hypothetical protein
MSGGGGNAGEKDTLTNFFNQQENELMLAVEETFFEDPKHFKYLKCLIEVLGQNSAYMDEGGAMSIQKLKEKNSAVRGLFQQRKVKQSFNISLLLSVNYYCYYCYYYYYYY